jgi:hypothetical protein
MKWKQNFAGGFEMTEYRVRVDVQLPGCLVMMLLSKGMDESHAPQVSKIRTSR